MSSDGAMFLLQPFGEDWETSDPGLSYALPSSSPSTTIGSVPISADLDTDMTASNPYIADMFAPENIADFTPSFTLSESGRIATVDPSQCERSHSEHSNLDKASAIACWASSICPSKEESGEYPGACVGICPLVPPMKSTELELDNSTFPLTHINSIKLEPEQVTATPPKMKDTKDTIQQDRSTSSKRSRPSPATTSSEDVQEKGLGEPALKVRDRVPHKDIEKRYRTKINGQLEALRKVLPKHQSTDYGPMDIEDITVKHASKPVILTAAITYIKELEEKQKRMEEELAAMKLEVQRFQNVSDCSDCSLVRYFNNLNLVRSENMKRQRH